MNYEAHFDQADEFLNFYGALYKNLPRRSKGRTKIAEEHWMFRKLSFVLVNTNLVSFPLSVRYSDRPDFRITTKDGCIGVEVTQSSGSNYALAMKISETAEVGMLERGDFRRDKERKRRDINGLMDKPFLTAAPWEGDEPEREWVERVKTVALEKVEKFKKYPDKDLFFENILLVFDVSPEPVRHAALTQEHLSGIFESENIASTFRYLLFADSHRLWVDVQAKTWNLL
jgi:hypothetical protein